MRNIYRHSDVHFLDTGIPPKYKTRNHKNKQGLTQSVLTKKLLDKGPLKMP